MLGFIAGKLGRIFDFLPAKITGKTLGECRTSIRNALIDCDVSIEAADALLEQIPWEEGATDLRSLVRERLADFLSAPPGFLQTDKKPAAIMLIGSQGSGKTTSAAKLALHLGKQALLVSTDNLRPAGRLQLKLLAESISVDFFDSDSRLPAEVWKQALKYAKASGHEVIICDTAGCMHVNVEALAELASLRSLIDPDEVVLVADALGGQDSLKASKSFASIGVSSILLSKADGDSQGAVALSIKHATGKPIRFLGLGEKAQDIEDFDPKRFANRVLDLGDIEGLIAKVDKVVDKKGESRLLAGAFDFDDYAKHISILNKFGGLEKVIQLLPGSSKLSSDKTLSASRGLSKHFGIINSMTKKEKKRPELLSDYSRKKRIARGSGTNVRDVEALVEQFRSISSMLSAVSKSPLAAAKSLLSGISLGKE